MEGINFLPFFILFSLFDYAVSDYCYHYPYGGSVYCNYHYYCYDFYYCYYYSPYSLSLSYGAIAGIVVGSLIFLSILITVIVVLCAACTKKAGRTGRVIYPTQGVHTVAYSAHQTYPYPPQAGYTVNTNAANFQADDMVPPPPSYNAPSHPPPKNEPMNWSVGRNAFASAPPPAFSTT